ncbi:MULTISPECIES: PstS family phosphate ABC transporter substrate-binding protein [Streptomyces]|uniref:PBP domain-containing protein n=1 Tax=Streptomyces albus (strain ATCC 21838 / DSM 41398 / FERM P-419 / JCM 4703 / NBRC 107858) TaxID=1081613 RepID=A0A0B5EZL6_STRA4|nr:substrate-binding domain-containing protein [Streptomyces sp. SCSIO ZS0520]AJE83502.1 hypothetical protein SLNWT_3126 [Streptomyces albus]AOU77810.1 hypothetical protein SLNHY_3119 [Streptomyces albus]AYN33570.1 hypothetical protein DUI70_3069 [Streptomyces albus]
MDWFSAENVIAVGTALLGVAATFGALVYERSPRQRHIGYRVQMDTFIRDIEISDGQAQGLGIFNSEAQRNDRTLVLLRVENDGSRHIGLDDYTTEGRRGLTAVFAGRTVLGCAVTGTDAVRDAEAEADPEARSSHEEYLTHAAGLRPDGSRLHIPRVPLNKGDHFKLLVLLSGGAEGGRVTVSGGLKEGAVSKNRSASTSLDAKPRQFSRPAQVLASLLTACVVTLAAIVVADGGESTAEPRSLCARGELRLTGSTAFAPVAEALKEAYEKECPKTRITVAAGGSATGIRELRTAGARAAEGAPAAVVFTDGPATGAYPQLQGRSLSVAAFALVVNDRVGLRDLTLAQVRDLYAGRVANWNQLPGGPDEPVTLVSRVSNSGTRDVLQRRLLGGRQEFGDYAPGGCDGKPEGGGRPERCELDSTAQVLEAVRSYPGAVGYSELAAATGVRGTHLLSLDGRAPSLVNLQHSGYRYRDVEFAYTYGPPAADSPAARFLEFVTAPGGRGEEIIREKGQLPCTEPEARRLCAQP